MNGYVFGIVLRAGAGVNKTLPQGSVLTGKSDNKFIRK